ncbi:hypothetical protein GCM10025864_08110 [Luteimicrobium album]|uniref:Uncharacterized protein n=1 Tax=Luteimicrobium album TaxID=1054550 RepID=A0ABQ6HXD2_9MICO|nr:hypothetical protein GCM10025864_08110 [Luteimicrobium album]
MSSPRRECDEMQGWRRAETRGTRERRERGRVVHAGWLPSVTQITMGQALIVRRALSGVNAGSQA